jgi:hypothetical protein
MAPEHLRRRSRTGGVLTTSKSVDRVSRRRSTGKDAWRLGLSVLGVKPPSIILRNTGTHGVGLIVSIDYLSDRLFMLISTFEEHQ